MMDYATFKAVVEQNILDYFPGSFRDAKVEITPAVKVNRTRDTLMIWASDDTKIAPNIFIDDMYEHYKSCEDINKVLSKAADIYLKRRETSKDLSLPEFTKDYVNENVYMVLANTESNSELLADIPHRDVNDCSVFYRLLIGKGEEGISSIIFDKLMAETAGMNEQELFIAATENTKRIFPVKIQPMKEAIIEMMTKDGMPKEIADAFIEEVGPADIPMWIMTNDIGVNGAVNMLYDENLHNVAERLNDDLYILPSSIHEGATRFAA